MHPLSVNGFSTITPTHKNQRKRFHVGALIMAHSQLCDSVESINLFAVTPSSNSLRKEEKGAKSEIKGMKTC